MALPPGNLTTPVGDRVFSRSRGQPRENRRRTSPTLRGPARAPLARSRPGRLFGRMRKRMCRAAPSFRGRGRARLWRPWPVRRSWELRELPVNRPFPREARGSTAGTMARRIEGGGERGRRVDRSSACSTARGRSPALSVDVGLVEAHGRRIRSSRSARREVAPPVLLARDSWTIRRTAPGPMPGAATWGATTRRLPGPETAASEATICSNASPVNTTSRIVLDRGAALFARRAGMSLPIGAAMRGLWKVLSPGPAASTRPTLLPRMFADGEAAPRPQSQATLSRDRPSVRSSVVERTSARAPGLTGRLMSASAVVRARRRRWSRSEGARLATTCTCHTVTSLAEA